jgi:hypothetical protein
MGQELTTIMVPKNTHLNIYKFEMSVLLIEKEGTWKEVHLQVHSPRQSLLLVESCYKDVIMYLFRCKLYLNTLCNKIKFLQVRFEVLMVISMKIAVFWDTAPCSLAYIN